MKTTKNIIRENRYTKRNLNDSEEIDLYLPMDRKGVKTMLNNLNFN